jgi:hypothetical protein
MKKLFMLVLVVLFVFSALNADYLVKQETKTGAVMGKQAKTLIQDLWIGDGVYANVQDKQVTIVNSKKKVMYIVYNDKKSYVEMKLPVDIKKYLPSAGASMVETMLNSMTAKVTPNGKTGKVGNWKTKGYNVVMTTTMAMGMSVTVNMDIEASTDVTFDWKKLSTEYMGAMMMSTGSMSSKVINEMKKIKGYTVKRDTSAKIMGMNMKTSMRVLEITKKDAPKGIYTVPAGYKKMEKLVSKQKK